MELKFLDRINLSFQPLKQSRFNHRLLINVDYVKNIDWSKYRPYRGGIIPYTFKNDTFFFCFGVDSKFKELTDFGGGIRYKLDKTALNGALREFDEESLGIFGEISNEQLDNSVVVYSDYTMIIFVYVDVNLNEIRDLFYQNVQYEKCPENEDICWLSTPELFNALKKGFPKIYTRVSKILWKGRKLMKYL